MNEYLQVLESAISDVGCWTWWTADPPGGFQVEFSGTQLWNAPSGDGKPPSGQIALRFRNPKLVYFLAFSTSMPQDWPDRLQRDEYKPFTVNHEMFTLTSSMIFARILDKAVSVRAHVGESSRSSSPSSAESFLAFEAGQVGLLVIAESMAVVNHQGELDHEAVLASSSQWWQYWREYWNRKDTTNPMPLDYACEVTIPAGPET